MTPLLRLRAAEFAGITGATTIPTQLTADPPLLRRAMTGLLAATRQPGPPLEHLFGGSVSRQGVRGPAQRIYKSRRATALVDRTRAALASLDDHGHEPA